MFKTTMDIIVFIFGMGSTVFTSVMNMPLAWKVYKTRDTQSLSYGTLIMTIIASVLWVIYSTLMLFDGYLIDFIDPLIASLPIFICNVLLFFIVMYIFLVKFKNDQAAKKAKAGNTTDVHN